MSTRYCQRAYREPKEVEFRTSTGTVYNFVEQVYNVEYII